MQYAQLTDTGNWKTLKCGNRSTETGVTKFTHVEVRKWLLSTCFLCHAHWFACAVARFNAIHVACVSYYKGIGYKFLLRSVVLWPRLLPFVSLARHPASCYAALSKVFSKHLQVYQCIRTHKSQQESMWVANIMNHSSTCTHSYSYWSHSASPFLATGLFH